MTKSQERPVLWPTPPNWEVNDARRLRLLEDENPKLKKLLADEALT